MGSSSSTFTASQGFLQKFFARHSMISVVQHGEAASVDKDAIPQVC